MKGAGHIVVSTVQQWGWKTQAEDYMDFGLKFAVAFTLVANILYGVGNQLEGIYIYIWCPSAALSLYNSECYCMSVIL